MVPSATGGTDCVENPTAPRTDAPNDTGADCTDSRESDFHRRSVTGYSPCRQRLGELPGSNHRSVRLSVACPLDLREKLNDDPGTVGNHRRIIDRTKIISDRLGFT
jgi:hypothetical protein